MSWDSHKWLEIRHSLIRYIKNPLKEIENLPSWDWPTLFILQGLVSFVSGVFLAIVKNSGWALAFSLILMPIAAFITSCVSGLFIYYLLLVFAQRQLPIRPLFTLILLALAPFFLLQPLSPLLPLINIIGFLFSALILTNGLIKNFDLERGLVLRIVGGLFVLVFIVVLVAWVKTSQY